ncbi:DUF4199 domain-containing protein [Marixanthomonas ophiurae]|uniref:DUF4199 domain-containing protein n=1 Tax=Marixanthomonas ophiurae TaxID=387659 RepID=A0A3E1Q9T4_9FLAO|nr:DUF4199 domain-containing protein [Marixanthomonas ophiurae]RFN58899.1 DUF4199 domain-containing protein [Marixanthomonas ophiurae]
MFKIYSRYGVIIAVALIVYFLLLKLFGLHQYPVLSAANGVIYGAGILLALKKYKADTPKFDYAKGFEVGFAAGAIATVIFTIFMSLYIFELDTEFAHNILDSWNMNFNKGTLILIISIVMMGVSTSLVLTLAFMQLLKDSWNTPEGKRNTM